MRNKTLLGAVLGVLGCVVLREAYAKGFNKGVEECINLMESTLDVVETVKKKENEDEES